MIRSALFAAALGLSGCSQSAEPSARAAADLNVTVKPQSPAAEPAAPQTAQPTQTPVAFGYPADLGGRAVERAVAPDRPALVADRALPAPRPRALPAKLLDPDATTRVSVKLPLTLPAKAAKVQPVPPRERVPAELGRGSEQVPSRPTFPVAAGLTERSRDVKLPPAMPTLGRPLAERVSLDDPTSEFANATIVAPSVKVPVAPAAFQKVSLPDPFELGDQIKPKVPPAAEPGLTPVVVNPQRVK